ncbi:MAG: hypothetical protein LBG11_11415 [Bifidobacteriaceae bacterium]|jgi:hypothetical protein|nr:hypothetical protein [Bifidobacteriaceae bacterium]
MPNRTLTLMGLALALILAGCSQPSGSAPTGAGPEGSSPSASRQNTGGGSGEPPEAQMWTLLPSDTPLAKYRQYLAGSTAEVEGIISDASQANDEREAIVADCMKQAGFVYHPLPYGGPLEAPEDLWLVRSWKLYVPPLSADRAEVEKWGYGISLEMETFEEQFEKNRNPEAKEVSQRNEEYVNSLTPAAQKEYQMALVGFEEVTDGPNPEFQGCVGEAYAQVPATKSATDVSDQFEDLYRAVVEVTKWDVGMDTEALALDQEFTSCLSDKGIDFSFLVFEDEYGWTQDVANLNRVSPSTVFQEAYALREDGSLTPEGEDFVGLQAYPRQVEIALADFDCREELDYMNRMMAIQLRVEQEFVDRHRDRLDELEAAATEPTG